MSNMTDEKGAIPSKSHGESNSGEEGDEEDSNVEKQVSIEQKKDGSDVEEHRYAVSGEENIKDNAEGSAKKEGYWARSV
jgi:hypothetical protein